VPVSPCTLIRHSRPPLAGCAPESSSSSWTFPYISPYSIVRSLAQQPIILPGATAQIYWTSSVIASNLREWGLAAFSTSSISAGVSLYSS
jgi:hypothetical protein